MKNSFLENLYFCRIFLGEKICSKIENFLKINTLIIISMEQMKKPMNMHQQFFITFSKKIQVLILN